MSWATFGCSFTKYHWYTWADFLKISVKKFKNYGIPGSSNEYICRQILKHGKNYNNAVVMWSGYDRVHNDDFLKSNGFNLSKHQFNDISNEQLLERTLEYIWLANRFCYDNNIKIYNFSMTVLELSETKKIIPMPRYLDIGHKNWPIDMMQYCLDNPSKYSHLLNNGHPLPSEHYNYFKDIMSPVIGVQCQDIPKKNLDDFDKKAVDTN